MTQQQLKPSLSLLNLIFLGVGTLVGVGVFVVAGVTAATIAGPSVIVSFILAGIAGLLTALCYAEMSACIGGSGGAYNYVAFVFGKRCSIAVGFCLLAIYALIVAYLAMGWSGYMLSMLQSVGIVLPDFLTHAYYEKGGLINAPAVVIVVLVAWMLMQGNKRGVALNSILVCSKLGVIVLFVLMAGRHVRIENLQDFMPFGWHGMIKGAAMVFNAYVGFDILASAAAETKNPQRSVPLAMIWTFVISVTLYVAVAIVLTGVEHYSLLNDPAAVSNVLIRLHLNWAAMLISAGAVLGITAVMFGISFASSRLSYTLAKDGFVPKFFSVVHPQNNTPNRAIIVGSLIALGLTVFIPFATAVKYINFGSLMVYMIVCFGVIRLRITQPTLARPFKLPLNPLIPCLSIIICLYLMFSLS